MTNFIKNYYLLLYVYNLNDFLIKLGTCIFGRFSALNNNVLGVKKTDTHLDTYFNIFQRCDNSHYMNIRAIIRIVR